MLHNMQFVRHTGRCPVCEGERVTACEVCDGMGTVVFVQHTGGGSLRHLLPCPNCQGRGYVDCPRCGGSGEDVDHA